MTLVVAARAKLNLDLAILERSDDGYHQVRTHIQAVALHDLIELKRADRTAMTISGPHRVDPNDNSVRKAHRALEAEAGRELPTAFHLDKRIPPGAGMGGASSDAAAALKGLAAIHNISADLHKIAAGIGADVPFFLNGGTALAKGRGERLTTLPTEAAWFAIAWPDIELSTASVYRAWDEVKGQGPNQLSDAAARVEPRVGEFAMRLGEGWQMTGSGSAFFLRCADERSAQQATAKLDCWTAVTHSVGPWA
ncbi:MAG TPA: 4-(cytidine 5'-diphospho)-2-C-methyl-D-erythritol kinase [Candidatus Dormibacteraeota bacterium]